MIRVRQLKIKLNDSIEDELIKKLKIKKDEIINIEIVKESIDSRKKPDIYLVYELLVTLKNESKIKLSDDIFISCKEKYEYKPKGNIKLNKRPIIVGAGPAGLFMAYNLALNGYNPIIVERGKKVEERIKDVEKFFNEGVLDEHSNVCFGEGGAGTFSDGKLNTMVKDPKGRIAFVLETFVKFGAPKEILYKAKPHIGTDILRSVIKSLREEIIKLGGEFRFETCLNDIEIKDGKIKRVLLNENYVDTDVLVLGIGHSARDTFYMLNKYLKMEAKPFALGIRIQHTQKMIDESQYGKTIDKLGPASYKLTYQTSKGRGVYTFCMCPGGYVVNSSSEQGYLSINGMSNFKRDTSNANSAIIVTVSPSDFGTSPLSGIEFQRNLERKAFEIGNGLIPTQLYEDFKNKKESTSFKSVSPVFKGGYTFKDLNKILPDYICDALKEGIDAFGYRIKGFSNGDAILSAIESRTSSPVKILRDENAISIEGVYPIGEGAGYAGGITSAAVDGLKSSEYIMDKYIACFK